MTRLLVIMVLALWASLVPAQTNLIAGKKKFSVDVIWSSWYQVTRHPENPDLNIMILWGGFLIEAGPASMRGERAVITLDRDEYLAGKKGLLGPKKKTPHVGLTPPKAGNAKSWRGTRRMFAYLLGLNQPPADGADGKKRTDLIKRLSSAQARAVQSIYSEGNVTLEQKGLKILSSSRLHIDLQDGSFTAEDTMLRLPSVTPGGSVRTLVIRADLVSEKGGHIDCRNSSVTYCDYAIPHYQINVGSLQGWFEEAGWVFHSKDNVLWLQSIPAFWVPSLTWRAGDSGPLPFQGVTVGRKSKWGPFIFTRWGQSYRHLGGQINDALGLPGKDFEGDWILNIGASAERGFPMDLTLEYSIPKVYEGWTRGFWLNDQGDRHKGSVRTEWDGSELPNNRYFLQTENRFHLAEKMTLDFQAFYGGDPGALPEFFESYHKNYELPETSLSFSWAADNRLLSLLGRWDINGYSYDGSRTLADSFVEQAPSAAFLCLGEPLLDLPWGQRLVWSFEAETTQFKHRYTTLKHQSDDSALRTFVEAEFSAPISFGPVRVRPFSTIAGARYDNVSVGQEETRILGAIGIQATTHFTRYYPVKSKFLGINGLLHQFDPEVSWFNRCAATEDPSDFDQFDWRDSLDNREIVTLALRNRFLTMRKVAGETRLTTVFLADLAANYYPNADRDNNGDQAGKIALNLAWQPQEIEEILGATPSLYLQGLYDPNASEISSLFVQTTIPLENFNFSFGWVSGANYKGTVFGGASCTLLGRWNMGLSTAYDLERDLTSGYSGSLFRNDHDWSMGLVFTYDEGENDYRATFRFTPGQWLIRPKHTPVSDLDPLQDLL